MSDDKVLSSTTGQNGFLGGVQPSKSGGGETQYMKKGMMPGAPSLDATRFNPQKGKASTFGLNGTSDGKTKGA